MGLALAAVSLLTVVPARARSGENGPLSHRKLDAVMTEAPPAVDGDLSDPAWQGAPVADRFADHFTGSTEIDQTEARLCYDEQAIYVSFRCFDARPQEIVAREIRRDSLFRGEDTVTFSLDPFRTRREDDTNWFVVNPLGTPAAHIAGGRANKTEWKGDWTCAARRDERGWTAEMRIPWEMVTFPTGAETCTMGINFLRWQARTRVNSYWSHVGPERRNDLAGDWEETRVPRRSARRSLSLLPYTTSRFGLGGGRDTGLGLGRRRSLNLGLDARMALTPELTAVGSLNPDFATVERAVEGIDFTRGERFVPDTRPFFLEGGRIFDLNVGTASGWGQAFFSGRIPNIDAGGKLYGRYGRRDTVGFLGTFNHETERGDFVGRWTHDVGPSSFVGAYAVHRALPGAENTLVGLNESIRLGKWDLVTDLATTAGPGAGGHAANTGFRWRSGPWRSSAGYTVVQQDFLAANGFVNFTDYHGPAAFVGYRTEFRRGPIRELEIDLFGRDQRRLSGDFFRRSLQLDVEVQTRNDWAVRAGWEGGRFLDEHDRQFSVGVTRNVSNRFSRVGVRYHFGQAASRPIRFVQPFVSRRLFGRWDFSLSAGILRHFADQELYVLTFARELSPTRAIGGRVLIRNGELDYFVSYRVSGGRGMETYILLGDPVGNGRKTRTRLMTKVVFPVSL